MRTMSLWPGSKIAAHVLVMQRKASPSVFDQMVRATVGDLGVMCCSDEFSERTSAVNGLEDKVRETRSELTVSRE